MSPGVGGGIAPPEERPLRGEGGGGGSSVVPSRSRACAWRGRELWLGWDVASGLPAAAVGASCLPASGRASSRRSRGRPRAQSPPAQEPAGHPGAAYWWPGCGTGMLAGHVNGRAPAWGLRLSRFDPERELLHAQGAPSPRGQGGSGRGQALQRPVPAPRGHGTALGSLSLTGR